LAHRLGLECEYSVAKQTLRISRPVPEGSVNSVSEYDRFINSELLENIGGAFQRISDDHPMSVGRAFPGDFQLDVFLADAELASWNQPLHALSDSEVRPSDEIRGTSVDDRLDMPSCWRANRQDQQSIPDPLGPAANIDLYILEDAEETMDHSHGFFHESLILTRHESSTLSPNSLNANTGATQDPQLNDTASNDGWHTTSTTLATTRSDGIVGKRKTNGRSMSPNYKGWKNFEFGPPGNTTFAGDWLFPTSCSSPAALSDPFQYHQPCLSQPPPLIMPSHPTRPSMLTNPENYPPASRIPPAAAPHSRKILTDGERRRMCLYHQENPTVKQTEIGGEEE
jgi:hypothetical protein